MPIKKYRLQKRILIIFIKKNSLNLLVVLDFHLTLPDKLIKQSIFHKCEFKKNKILWIQDKNIQHHSYMKKYKIR